MKTSIKHESGEFLVMSLKHVSGVTSRTNHLGTPKLWAMADENAHKTRKRRVFVHNSQKMYRVITSQENSHGTPELWAIGHENVHKTRKRRVLVMYRVF